MAIFERLYLTTLRWIVILCMAGMLGLIFANVVLRYAFNSAIFVSEGLSGLLYVWMTFVGALLVLYERGHIGVDALVRKLPLVLQRVAFFLTNGIMLYVTWLLLQGSWHQAMINMPVISPATRLPIGLMYLAGVFFAVMSGLFLLVQLVKLLTGRLDPRALILSSGEDEAEAERLMASGAEGAK